MTSIEGTDERGGGMKNLRLDKQAEGDSAKVVDRCGWECSLDSALVKQQQKG